MGTFIERDTGGRVGGDVVEDEDGNEVYSRSISESVVRRIARVFTGDNNDE